MKNINTPVLFLIFNRLDTTKQVFSVIKKVKPIKLYIASDGPRKERKEEQGIVDSVRDYVLSNVNWDCEIKTLFRDSNLGCKIAVSSAIDWFFKNEEEGIILEDDCLPNESFFFFCQNLLEKYRYENRISTISGNNFNINKVGGGDYYFKRLPHIWGWATWRRTWNKYSLEMQGFEKFKKEKRIKKIWSKKKVQKYWIHILEETLKKESGVISWDYQLCFLNFKENFLSISPNVNLVRNIGIGDQRATNTILRNRDIGKIKNGDLFFPLKHPGRIIYSEENDYFTNKIALRNFRIKFFLRKIGIFVVAKNIIRKINFSIPANWFSYKKNKF